MPPPPASEASDAALADADAARRGSKTDPGLLGVGTSCDVVDSTQSLPTSIQRSPARALTVDNTISEGIRTVESESSAPRAGSPVSPISEVPEPASPSSPTTTPRKDFPSGSPDRSDTRDTVDSIDVSMKSAFHIGEEGWAGLG